MTKKLLLTFALLVYWMANPLPAFAIDLSFRSFTSANAVGDLTSNLPAGAVQNDILIAAGFTASNGATPPTTFTPPAGWTQIETNTQTLLGGVYSVRWGTYYKIAGASEPASYTWTANGNLSGSLIITAYDNPDTTAPFQTSVQGTFSGTATPSATQVTTTRDNQMVMTYFVTDGGGVTSTWTAPSGMTERVDTTSSLIADVIQTTAGASGAKQATASNSGGGWFATMAFRSDTTPVVTTDSASAGTRTGLAFGNVTNTGGLSITTQGFNYGIGAFTATSSNSGTFGAGSFNASTTSLICNSTYQYRAFATNASTTAYGSQGSFTTAACPRMSITSYLRRVGGLLKIQ